MALFKPMMGNSSALASQTKQAGYAWFCTDDGAFHIDYLDAEGNLQRKQINDHYINETNEKIATLESQVASIVPIFIGTAAEYDAANAAGKIAMGSIVIITDDGTSGGNDDPESGGATTAMLGYAVLGQMKLGEN